MTSALSVGLAIGGCVLVSILSVFFTVIARRDAATQRRNTEQELADLRAAVLRGREESALREREILLREKDLADRERAIVDQSRHLADLVAELDHKGVTLDQREHDIAQREHDASERMINELARISGLDRQQAFDELTTRLVDEARGQAAAQIRQIEEDSRRASERRAQEIVATAVQRLAVPTSSESVVALVMLPSEDFKGRIIGREGRNIRTFEALTGVNLIVDDSPDSVLLSCFDPARREVAQLTLESLLADGRIHPQRIEAAFTRAKEAVTDLSLDAGRAAAERAHVMGLPEGVLTIMGDLRLRTSYGQNVLNHLVETALLAASMASELGLDAELARRAAFLHDIGKALTHEVDGSHAIVGAELLDRHGESDLVVNAVAAHHDEVDAASVEAVIVQAADAASAARPGARREELDQYLERMRLLENIARRNPGVRQVYAMSAGREIRIAVEPSVLSDQDTQRLAAEVAAAIRRDVSFPGQIHVVAVRELRASATAG